MAQLVGVGGAASILGCMEAELTSFDRARLEATACRPRGCPGTSNALESAPRTAQADRWPAEERADIILMGVAIYQAVMEAFEFPDLRISTRGLRFAALLQNDPQR